MIRKPLVTIVVLAILSLLVAAGPSQDENSSKNRQQFKRFRGEPIRFGKRVPREPIRFGKRIPMFESYFDY